MGTCAGFGGNSDMRTNCGANHMGSNVITDTRTHTSALSDAHAGSGGKSDAWIHCSADCSGSNTWSDSRADRGTYAGSSIIIGT